MNQPPKNFMKSLQVIHVALLLGVLLFSIYVAYSTKNQLFFSYKDGKAFLYLAIIVAFVGNLASKNLYQKLISQISKDADLKEKVSKFSTAHIFRVVMLEFPAFMCIVFVLNSYNSFYFILVGILVLMMLVIYPTKLKFENDIPLTTKEKNEIQDL